ncbi:hypothetical protein EXS71_02420 [Candidatus Uhrbacteria bacterium]|nr:hypothetical protein [Candidatus Uhrbacteria bacterium]
MFNVIIRKDISLADLAHLHHKGDSVQKTPHVGNIYGNNLAIGALGIPMNLYDRTLGIKDYNFHPHRVIHAGKSETISNPELLTSHACVLQPSTLAPKWFTPGARLTEGHLASVQAAVPGEWLLYTDYLSRHAEDIIAVIETLFDHPAVSWERHVDADGCVTKPGHAIFGGMLKRVGIFGLTNSQAGWLTPNILNILIDGMVEAKLRGVRDVYHLSGPDMVLYINGLLPSFHALYDQARKRLGWRELPETLTFHLIPVADMRFAVLNDRRMALNALIDAWLNLEAGNRRRAIRFQGVMDQVTKKAIVQEVGASKDKDLMRVRQAVHDCPEIFYQIERPGSAFTQYDVLERGLYVHPWGVENSLEVVGRAMRLFERFHSC